MSAGTLEDYLPLVVLAGLVASVMIERWRNRVAGGTLSWWSKENMPLELRQSQLVMNEQDVSLSTPLPLYGTVDQVFRRPDHKLVPVDTKTRKRHVSYLSDKIQLSVYAYCLRGMYGADTVAGHGYVRTVIPGIKKNSESSVRYIRTKLLTVEELAAMYRRYNQIKRGEVKTKCTCGGSLHI